MGVLKEEICPRTKLEFAQDLMDEAAVNGLRFKWAGFDSFYGRDLVGGPAQAAPSMNAQALAFQAVIASTSVTNPLIGGARFYLVQSLPNP